MKKGLFLALACYFSFFTLHAAELLSINFSQDGEISNLELEFDSQSVDAKKFHNAEDKQIIIDIKNAKASEKVLRAFDTSEFSGSLVFVQTYPKADNKDDLRIALQLRENVRSVLKKAANRYILSIENRFGVLSQSKVQKDSFEELQQKEHGELKRVHIPRSDSLEDILANLTMSGKKKYIGKRISFDVTAVPVESVLKMIADSSGFNIIITDDIRKLAPLTLKLTNIPWDQVLDTVLGLNKLVAKKNGVILMISTLDQATEERKLELQADNIAKNQEPLVTKIFPISYASAADLQPIVKEYLTPKRGKITIDERNNALIVKDVMGVIDKIKKIKDVLDTQTPQVLIESKIVEVTESYAKKLGLQNGLGFGYDPIGEQAASLASVGASTTSGGGVEAGPGFSFSTAPSGETNLMGVTIGQFGRVFGLNFNLQLMESESKGKVISAPRVITQNKKPATITTTDTTSYAVTTGSGDTLQTTFDETEASLALTVTPQVTNEGSIMMEVDLSKTSFGSRPAELPNGPPEKASRAVKTNVLVDNGSTIVIGGIYSFEKKESHSGVPFLKDLPLVGWLFRSYYNPESKKNEMIIFLTPRIINQEAAGLSGGIGNI